MATRRSTNGQDEGREADGLMPQADFDLNMPTGLYLGYEQVVGTLMWACMESDVLMSTVENRLETTTLEREFRGRCVPANWERPFSLFAEIAFAWPAEYTTLSIYGDEGLCSLYHSEGEPCQHQEQGASPFIEVEITYRLPHGFVQQLDSDEGIEGTASRVRRVFAEVVGHKNIVTVVAQASYSGHRLQLTEMSAYHFWHLEEELQDLPLLGKVFLSIAEEVRQVLDRFAAEFPGGDEDVS